MKQKNVLTVAIALLGLFIFVDAASAQGIGMRRHKRPRVIRQQNVKNNPTIGLFYGHNFSAENNLVGGKLNLPLGRFWDFVPSAEYNLLNTGRNENRWQFNGDLVFMPVRRGFLYFGGGVAVEYKMIEKASQTNFGGNALVGLEFGRAPMTFFVQGRWTFLEDTNFTVMGGLNLALR